VGATIAPPPKAPKAATPASVNGSGGGGGGGLFSMFGSSSGSSEVSSPPSKVAPKGLASKKQAPVAAAAAAVAPKQLGRKAASITDITIGNGEYALAGVAKRSTSGKSQIWKVYKLDGDGNPIGAELTAKISLNFDILQRENDNYNKVASGLVSGAFVKKYEYLERTEASKPNFDNQCALIMESGLMDLAEFLRKRNNQGLQGKTMRDAAAAAGQCVQAMHNSRMVWTDLKTENFVVTEEPTSEDSGLTVRGIDLESAQAFNANPSDFSPEACPPEFAEAYLEGEGPEFILQPSYDIWSLGMMLFELSTGKPYFFKKNGTVITKTLRKEDFVADVSAIQNDKLRDLVSKCLQRNPNKRPSISAFLLHPYFTTSGFGAWSF
jgi:serine/threonine protein kinase